MHRAPTLPQPGYSQAVIVTIRHRGLRYLHERDDPRYLPPQHIGKIEDILGRLDVATEPSKMDVPGLRLHPLTGDRAGVSAVRVSRNWRIIFRFEGSDVYDVDFVDYH